MRKLALLISISFLLVCSAHAQCTPPPGGWSQSSLPPLGCRPYPNSLWLQQLPNAGSGGPTNLSPFNSRAAQMAGGVSAIVTTGNDGTQMQPFYYGRASDPIYSVGTACTHPGSVAANNPTGTFWHIPDQAQYAGGQSDMFFTVFDQVSGKLLSTYTSGSGVSTPALKLQHCTATTNATACPMFRMGFCNMAVYATDKGYQAGNGAGDSLGEAPSALYITNKEVMASDFHGIKHAIYINVGCEDSSAVFPSAGHAFVCVSGVGLPHGSLIFFNYTDAEIAAMSVTPLTRSLVWTMTHYGGYVGDTSGQVNTFITPNRWEAGEAYTTAGLTDPLFAWLDGQGYSHHTDGTSQAYVISIWNGVPNLSSHIRVAAECVAKGLANVSGGCATATPPPPPPPPDTCTPPSGGWSEANQQPSTCVAFPSSLFSKLLPSNVSNHIVTTPSSSGPYTSTSDTMINAMFHDSGAYFGGSFLYAGDTGNQNSSFYYGRSNANGDATYKFTACTYSGTPMAGTLNVPIHLSHSGLYVGSGYDKNYVIWDQVTDNIYSGYQGGSGSGRQVIPACPGTTGHAGTDADPCPVSVNLTCGVAHGWLANTDPRATYSGWESMGSLGPVGLVRLKELVDGHIHHALYLNEYFNNCDTELDTGHHYTVFPNSTGNGTSSCGQGRVPTNKVYAPSGAMIYADYTPAQLADMCPAYTCGSAGVHAVPPWQYAFLEALSKYGGYIGDGGLPGITQMRMESVLPYAKLGIPTPAPAGFSSTLSWLASQPNSGCSGNCTLEFLKNVPLEGGTGVQSHLHIVDQCVARGMAGLSGGCADGGTPTPPPPPTGLTATVT